MVEPVQGEGGVHPATKEFMQGLRTFCDENDMLLLIDEVQTGWCRTGAVMSYMNYGIKPDIVSMAKGLGGGMPIGAICATAEVAKAFPGISRNYLRRPSSQLCSSTGRSQRTD